MSLRPTFMGMETMKKAINASQKSLDVTGNNLSNVETPGYTRQRLDLVSINNYGGTLKYRTAISLSGQGVGMTGVTQLRDPLLDRRYRDLSSQSATFGTQTEILVEIEDLLSTFNTDGFNTAFASIKDILSKNITDNASRAEISQNLMGAFDNAVKFMHSNASKLQEIEQRTRNELDMAVDEVNSILTQIAELNNKIKDSYIASGDFSYQNGKLEVNTMYGPLELKDKRNALLDSLSAYGNIQVENNNDGSINVKFAGVEALRDERIMKLQHGKDESGATTLSFRSPGGIEHLVTAQGGSLENGGLRGYLNMLNGAGKFSGSMEIYKKGTDEQLSKINDILLKVSALNNSDASDADKKLAYLKYEKELKAFNTAFTIGSDYQNDSQNFGIVKLGNSELVTKKVGEDPSEVRELKALVDNHVEDANTIIRKAIQDRNKNGTPPVTDADLEAFLKTALTPPTPPPGADPVKSYASKVELDTAAVPNVINAEVNGVMVKVAEKNADGTWSAFAMTETEKDASYTVKFVDGNGQLQTVPKNVLDTKGVDADGRPTDSLQSTIDKAINMRVAGTGYSKENGILYYQKLMDALANTFARSFNQMNSVNEGEVDFYYTSGPNQGKQYLRPIFEPSDPLIEITAANISLSQNYMDDPTLVTKEIVHTKDENGNDVFKDSDKKYDELSPLSLHNLNNCANNKVWNWCLNSNITGTTGGVTQRTIDKYISFYSEDISKAAKDSDVMYTVNDVMMNTTLNDRDSIMGVSIDEEGSNMMMYQKWYNASARIMTAMDEALDTVINNMGIVGR